MLTWFKKYFCFHKWEHIETYTVHNTKTEPPYFVSSYRCTKCGKTKYNCIRP